MVTCQAGTGKSRVVNVIRDDCRQRGLKVAVICSSGIACQVYDRGVASTADMPSGQLIDRATSNVAVSGKLKLLKTVDVVIWDEASMSSARMLELVNPLHHRLCEDESEEESLPFAGKQFIIVGAFLQLRPLAGSFDSGSFMDPQLKSMATHIFLKKNSVFLFNRAALEELDGELLRFDATLDGKGEKMSFPCEKTL